MGSNSGFVPKRQACWVLAHRFRRSLFSCSPACSCQQMSCTASPTRMTADWSSSARARLIFCFMVRAPRLSRACWQWDCQVEGGKQVHRAIAVKRVRAGLVGRQAAGMRRLRCALDLSVGVTHSQRAVLLADCVTHG